MKERTFRLLAALLALLLLLAACGRSGKDPNSSASSQPLSLTICAGERQTTLDPAQNTTAGGETILFHLFENLMRWEDDGSGFAVLAPGQAESYTLETDYAGNATYTFTLREGLQWSDGKAVTAGDFVAAWRRLADPANELPHRELLSMVAGYEQPVPEDWTGEAPPPWDPTLLGVSAPDDRTFVVSLVGSCAYFLGEVCAGAYTMPVREDLLSGAWGDGAVTNGAYTAISSDGGQLTLERSGTYYDAAHVGPQSLCFLPSGDSQQSYDRFLAGEIDLVTDLPSSAVEELAAGNWLPEPVTSTYAVALNTRRAPFDDPNVRLAFQLAVDVQALTAALEDPTLRPAAGLVPYGISDYGVHSLEEENDEPASDIPDPYTEPEPEPLAVYWDFRVHSQELVTTPSTSGYEENCNHARELLAQAGYSGGSGFPEVEYLYVSSPQADAAARLLQTMWKEQLGVPVTLRAVAQSDLDAALTLPPVQEGDSAPDGTSTQETDEEVPVPAFQMAGLTFSAAYSDAKALLGQWYSNKAENFAGYQSEAFDILLESAQAAVAPEVRDAYLHDAEAILLGDAPVIPLFCLGTASQLRDGLEGLFRGPDGVYFLSGVTAISQTS